MAAINLVSVVCAATAVAAFAVSSPTRTSYSTTSRPVSHRSLQDGNGNSYAYLDDLTAYQLQYSNCVRVKVPQEYDDDAAEGNVNFYNGRYHAQYQIFATFHVCGDGNYGNGNQCYDCDYGVEYTSEVGNYLETTLEFYEEYCEECREACGGRRLEDEAAKVDCNSCSNVCMTFYQGQNDDAAVDESTYVECSEGYVDEDGIQLYYGPQCSDDGRLIIGTFYDEECTIKTKHDYPDFGYYKFAAVQGGCLDCSTEQGGGACDGLYGDAYHCLNGSDEKGEDDMMSICSTVKKAMTTIDYSGVKKRGRGADMFIKVFFCLLGVGLVGGFFFLTYTYYIRHRGEKAAPMLTSEDVHQEEEDPQTPPGMALT